MLLQQATPKLWPKRTILSCTEILCTVGEDEMGWMASLTLSLSTLWEVVKDKEAWCATAHGLVKTQTWLRERQQQRNWLVSAPGCLGARLGRFSGRKQKGDHDSMARGIIWKLSYITYLWPGHTVGPRASSVLPMSVTQENKGGRNYPSLFSTWLPKPSHHFYCILFVTIESPGLVLISGEEACSWGLTECAGVFKNHHNTLYE